MKKGWKEEAREHGREEEQAAWWKGPAKLILALFLLLMVVLWAVPYYSIKLNPEPTNIPSLSLIQSQFLDGVEIGNETGTDDLRLAAARIRTDDPLTRQIAAKIATESCAESEICHAKALYYFVRDNIKYVSDPYEKEYVASPVETLKTGGGDCDDGSLLLAALIESIGIKTRIVIVPGHAFVKALMPEAPPRYRIGEWVYMDWTCKGCEFGNIPYSDVLQIE